MEGGGRGHRRWNAVEVKDVSDGLVVGGVPAKVLRPINKLERALLLGEELEEFEVAELAEIV